MKVSELIVWLQNTKVEFGDIEVKICSNDGEDGHDATTIFGGTTIVDDDDTPKYFLICDRDTLDAFN